MSKGIAKSDAGRKYRIVEPKELGLVPCIGEAHLNAYIDNCMLCAPRWGRMMSYEKILPEAVGPGEAARYSDADSERFMNEAGFEIAQLTETTRAQTTTFFAWVRS